jgi:hypothetical protein
MQRNYPTGTTSNGDWPRSAPRPPRCPNTSTSRCASLLWLSSSTAPAAAVYVGRGSRQAVVATKTRSTCGTHRPSDRRRRPAGRRGCAPRAIHGRAFLGHSHDRITAPSELHRRDRDWPRPADPDPSHRATTSAHVRVLGSAGGDQRRQRGFVGLFISEHTPLFGFMEHGYRLEIVIALAAEAVAIISLGGSL